MSPTPSESARDPSPFIAVADGVRVRIKVTPKARAERVHGFVADQEGSPWLKVAVTAAPENGKANAAVIALLARQWRLPKSTLAVTAGATDRTKTLTIAGDPDALLAHLSDWTATHAPNAGG